MYYVLDIAMRKWFAIKVLKDYIKDKQLLDFRLGTKCKSACKLLIQFGLPCKY
jgi:hypothetical protein